jgi:transposase
MPSNQPPSDDLMTLAAELRAGGLSWEAVAAKVDRSAETVRKWPTAYPDRWHALLHAAERRLARDAAAESMLILRQLLRSDDEKVRRDAARLLINLRVELDKIDLRSAKPSGQATTSDAIRLLARMLGIYTDEQLAQLVEAEFERCPGPRALLPARLEGGPA